MAEINIYGYIGEDLFFEGVSLKSVSDQLNQITEKDLTVNISSGGGSVNEGKAIYTLLKNSGKNITVKIVGQAYSIASVIAMCGNKILIGEFADMMVHPAWTYAEGNADQLEATAEQLRTISNELFSIYLTKDNLKKNEAKLKEYFDSEKIISAKECIELGLADGYLEDNQARIKQFIPLKAVAYYSKNTEMNTEDNKKAKSLLAEISAWFAGVKASFTHVKNMATKAGDTTFYSEGTPEVGTAVFSDEAMTQALADGTYGDYTCASGKITAIAATDSADVTELKNQIEELNGKLAEAIAEKKTAEDAKAEIENKFNTQVVAMEAKVKELETTIVGEGGRHSDDEPEETPKKKALQPMLDVLAQANKLKKVI